MIFEIILTIALCLLMLAIMANLYRVIKGPSSADRVQALDSIGINLIASIAVFSVLLRPISCNGILLAIWKINLRYIKIGQLGKNASDCR